MLTNMRALNPKVWTTGDTVRELLDDVNELLGYIAILKTPEVDAVRDGLEQSLRAARRKLLATEMYLTASGDAAARPGASGRVPWRAVAIAATVSGLTGFLLISARRRSGQG